MIETWSLVVVTTFTALAFLAWVKFSLMRLAESATRFSNSRVHLAERHVMQNRETSQSTFSR